MDIKYCLEHRFLIEIEPSADLMQKELAEAVYDFDKAKKAFKKRDWKWSIVQAYYCMFHAARAVLFKIGLREKRHFAVGVVLDDLNKRGKLESKYVDDFNAALSSREDADYHYIHSKEDSEDGLKIAEDFLARMNQLLNEFKKNESKK